MIKESSKLNIKTCAYFVIGSEAENELDRELTKQYVIQLAKDGLDEMGIFTLMAHPNTSISKSMYNNKLNVDNWEEVFQGIVPKSHKHYYEIKKFRLNLYTQFYFFQILFHPNKILRIIKNFIIQKQETKTDRVLLLFIKTILRKMGFKVRL